MFAFTIFFLFTLVTFLGGKSEIMKLPLLQLINRKINKAVYTDISVAVTTEIGLARRFGPRGTGALRGDALFRSTLRGLPRTFTATSGFAAIAQAARDARMRAAAE